jgi:NAD(P)-dependent dehydrogenase (short-subunit alcohol dehydrogenase family)
MTGKRRVTVITGAAGGIGRAMVRAFLDQGDVVHALDRTAVSAADLAPGVVADRLYTHVADVTDLAALKTLAGQIGPADVVLANAGGVLREIVTDIMADWQGEIALNLSGAAYVVEAFRPGMEARGKGAVVLTGSVNGLQYFGHPAYSAAKAGLIGHTRSLACMLGPKNIRVNLIAPGTVRTPSWETRLAANPQILDDVKRWYPLGRICRPEDIASAAVFLASDAAGMITGVTLPVDGGLTAGNFAFASQIS